MTNQADGRPPGAGRILIVDDEPLNVDYLEQELESRGFVIESAANGREALERVAASPPDLVLLDVMMPELDGIATLRILKQDTETRLIPVVLMTALNAVEDRVRGIEAGADDFLSKPVDDRELLARIRTAISRKRTVDEAVGELRSTNAYLNRFGRQERDVAVLAVDWVRDEAIPENAVAFVGRRHREVAENVIGAFGGTVSESEGDEGMLVAVFDGPDRRFRSLAAIEAAHAVVGQDDADAGTYAPPPLAPRIAVVVGPTVVGSIRMGRGTDLRWAWGAEGEVVERASALAREAPAGAVVISADAAGAASDRFIFRPVSPGVFVVREPGAEDGDGPRTSDRRITTILVTDIVGSTSLIERMGDRAGGELLAAHERVTRTELVLHGGEEINVTGDGFVVAFDSPANAIRCARAVLAGVRELGLVIRAGIHTGEIERVDGMSRGIAMHVASRIAAQAAPGEVLVSSTTHDLVAGASLAFVDRGPHRLKGLTAPRQLFAAVDDRSGLGSAAAAPTLGGRSSSLPTGLTGREVEVLTLVASGMSNVEVSQALYVSVRTVNAHLRSIYRKAGV